MRKHNILNRSAKQRGTRFTRGGSLWYTAENGASPYTKGRPRMKKKQFLLGSALLAASSALCLRLMKRAGEKLKQQQTKADEKNRK